MTIKLLPTTCPPRPEPERLLGSSLPPTSGRRPGKTLHVVVQLALKIELPTDDTDSSRSSGTIVIGLTPG